MPKSHDLPIGATISLKVVERHDVLNCEDCFFRVNTGLGPGCLQAYTSFPLECNSIPRQDGKSVKFVLDI